MATVRTTVSDRIRGTYENARAQVRGFEKQVAKIEKKAKAQLESVPGQLKGAWETVLARLRTMLSFATREELHAISEQLEELAKKVDRLLKKTAAKG